MQGVWLVVRMVKSYQDLIKFLFVIMIGGFSWVFAGIQVKMVGTFFALAYRLIFGSVLMISYALLTNRRVPVFDKANVFLLVIKALFLFSLNYALSYEGLKYITGGQASLIIAVMIVPNIIFGYFILDEELTAIKLFSSSLAIIGITIVFCDEIIQFYAKGSIEISGLALVLSSTCLSALGTVLGGKLLKTKKIDSIWSIGIAMGIGGVLISVLGFIVHREILFSTEPIFIYTQLILATASPISFIVYFDFVIRYGTEKASYMWLLSPVFAIISSSIYEGLVIDWYIVVGALVILSAGYLSTVKTNKVIKQ